MVRRTTHEPESLANKEPSKFYHMDIRRQTTCIQPTTKFETIRKTGIGGNCGGRFDTDFKPMGTSPRHYVPRLAQGHPQMVRYR